MANWYQNLFAFFDPTVAVNDEGYLVEADGFFDSGDSSIDYIDPSNYSDARDFFYRSDGIGFAPTSPTSPTSPDVFNNPDEYADDLLNELKDAAKQQQEAAQTSADRAMEFETEQAKLYRDWQEKMTDQAWNRQMDASNTAYQRAMADMKAAGLNPKLVAKIGGATSPSSYTPTSGMPSGSSANMQMANIGALSSVLSSYITGADALDRSQLDFVQRSFSSLLNFLPYLLA